MAFPPEKTLASPAYMLNRLPMQIFKGLALLILCCACTATSLLAQAPSASAGLPAGKLSKLVNPFIGTGGHGHTHPAASRPFGMIQAGPDTRLSGWDGCSGYHYDSDTMYGFSQTHLSGTGVSDYGDILLMPFSGEGRADFAQPYPFASRFSHAAERASPGYYSVRLQNGIQVEIAAAERSAMYRIIYPAPAQGVAESGPGLWIDLEHRDALVDAGLEPLGLASVQGYRISDAWALQQQVYFHLDINRTVESFSQDGMRAALNMSPNSGGGRDTILLRIAISAVDVQGAQRNLESEIPHWDFDLLLREAQAQWEEALGRIRISGGSPKQQSIFYTALYHALLVPNLFGDVDGRYRAMDREVYTAEGFTPYTVFSLWDTYRAAHPLYTLLYPSHNKNFVLSMLDDYSKGGRLPVWKLADYETDCMIGYHSVPVIVDAWFKGMRDMDDQLALEAMMHSAERAADDLMAYERFGYIPADISAESVSKTLEYAYDNACIARMAAAMDDEHRRGLRSDNSLPNGRTYADIAEKFVRISSAWKHLFDPQSGFFRARMNGAFVQPFDPSEVNHHYTEANAWHYAFSVPQDIMGHARMMGAARLSGMFGASEKPSAQAYSADDERQMGRQLYCEQLDALFEAPSLSTGRQQADITGLIGQYAHGNEPSHHIAYAYAQLGQPWKTQERVRQIMNELYRAAPDGLCGNEDCGQMSAWYVLSASGFYPMAPGWPEYTLGSPLFDTIWYVMEDGAVFQIVALDQDVDRPYIRSAELNGRAYDSVLLHHEQIARGGKLVLGMSEEPVREWGVQDIGAARSNLSDEFLAAPYVSPAQWTFKDSLRVELHSADPLFLRTQALLADPLADVDPAEQVFIEWKLMTDVEMEIDRKNGTSSGKWQRYDRPLVIHSDTELAFRTAGSVKDGSGRSQAVFSPVQYARFLHNPRNYTLEIVHPFAPQYAAGGDEALIDLLQGGWDYRDGFWQGYEHVDLEAVVDFGQVQHISGLGARFLQDQNSWIFFPLQVDFEGSVDGVNWHWLGEQQNTSNWDEEDEVAIRNFSIGADAQIRYLRVRAINRGHCPPGHKGAGGKSWIFCDEILIYE